MGLTELGFDSDGRERGRGLGDTHAEMLEWAEEANARLQATESRAKQLRSSGTRKGRRKARNIYKNNVGRKKLNKQLRKDKSTMKCLINRALNELLFHCVGEVNELVVEDLSDYVASNFGKKMNNRLNKWMRGYIAQRLQEKCRQLGIKLLQVNPAYTSQTCPRCGHVNKCNRKGDVFKCLNCGYEGHADVVGAKNICVRPDMPKIKLKMPPLKVKDVLDQMSVKSRHAKGNLQTVSGKTGTTARPKGKHRPPGKRCHGPRANNNGGLRANLPIV